MTPRKRARLRHFHIGAHISERDNKGYWDSFRDNLERQRGNGG